ncbi:protein of unknown function [Candidatus Filomicrobium marinum]|uniref:Uncharacterized protein n=1 Tax=Candidatus Filomicrobium marinum TaxID=1608628 RepID=A0A0D6JF13_9HYPH|nr:protein of unknown function [Candidatus Filomicrobium marinum]
MTITCRHVLTTLPRRTDADGPAIAAGLFAFREHHRDHYASVQEFNRRYVEEILAPLDPQRVVDDLLALTDGRVPTLLCWEQRASLPRLRAGFNGERR